MGMTQVPLTIKNPQNPHLQITDNFLVDSGAGFTVLSAPTVKKLRLKPIYKKEFILADGRKVIRHVGSALIKLKDKEMPSAVVLGQKNDSQLLGALTLESFGLILDPFERKLHPAHLML